MGRARDSAGPSKEQRLGRVHASPEQQVTKGRDHTAEEGKRLKTFKVYRYDPDSGANPRFDKYTIDLDKMRADGPRRPDQDQE